MIVSLGTASLDFGCFGEKCSSENEAAVAHYDPHDSHEESDHQQDHCMNHCSHTYALPSFNIETDLDSSASSLFSSYLFNYESQDSDCPFQPPKA